MTTETKSNSRIRAERYAAMLPSGADFEIKEEDGMVLLTVRNSIEYMFLILRDSAGTRTRVRAYQALNGRRTRPVPVRHIPWQLREWFVS